MNYANSSSVDVDYDGQEDGGLSFSNGRLPPVDEKDLDETRGITRHVRASGVGMEGQGADIAFGDVDGDAEEDVVLAAYDSPPGANTVRYRVGLDVTDRGVPRRRIGGYHETSGFGTKGQGLGVDIADVDGNGTSDLIVMGYDNPPQANTFRYKVGFDLQPDGSVRDWSDRYTIAGVGWEGDGAALTTADLNGNGQLEMILAAYDDVPDSQNEFRYKIGKDLSNSGEARSWTERAKEAGTHSEGDGIGVRTTDLNGNGTPELVLMAYDATPNNNTFTVKVGEDLKMDGSTDSWSSPASYDGVGYFAEGAGVAIADFDNSGTPDVLMMAYDAPSGEPNEFRYIVGRELQMNGTVTDRVDEDPRSIGFERDWNRNGILESSVRMDVNDRPNEPSGSFDVLRDHDDWSNLNY